MIDAFRTADQVLFQGVDGHHVVITTPGLINLDFADVRSVMTGAGVRMMGIGQGRVRTARGGRSIGELVAAAGILYRGARGLLLSVAGPPASPCTR